MSKTLAAAPAAVQPAASSSPPAGMALGIGLAGTAVTALGLLFSGVNIVATAWLVGVAFWTAMAIGMLMLVLIHHIFDAM